LFDPQTISQHAEDITSELVHVDTATLRGIFGIAGLVAAFATLAAFVAA
jgi:hypothetical protein